MNNNKNTHTHTHTHTLTMRRAALRIAAAKRQQELARRAKSAAAESVVPVAVTERWFMLFLCPRDVYNSKLDRNRFDSVDAISHEVYRCGGKVISTGPGWSGWDAVESVASNMKRMYPTIPAFDLVLTYGMDTPVMMSAHTVITLNELYTTKHQDKARAVQPSYVIYHHSNEMTSLWLPGTHIPHAADPRVFKCLPTDKKVYDFALVGQRSHAVYPLRSKLSVALAELGAEGYACLVHTHPGYTQPNPIVQVKEYVDVLRQTRVAVTCTSAFRYRLSKLAEIPLCGAAVATDMPQDGAPFFKRFVIELEPTATISDIKKTLVRGLKSWEERMNIGRTLTQKSSLQAHYAVRFLAAYEENAGTLRPTLSARDIVAKETLRLDSAGVVFSNHCWWLPEEGVKVPHQRCGELLKNVDPPEVGCSLASLAVEYTILKEAHRMLGIVPPVGKIVVYDNAMVADGSTRAGPFYGYEMANANALPRGPLTSQQDAKDKLRTLPVFISESALSDFTNESNIVNGYIVDVRRSPHDMPVWQDPNTLVRIPRVNMLRRSVLLVVDVQGWAWDNKAKAIQKYYRGASTVSICYMKGAPTYSDAMLEDRHHVHFFGWRHVTAQARALEREGRLVISTTIASIEHKLDGCAAAAKRALSSVHVVCVSPFLAEECRRDRVGCTVTCAMNGVDTTVYEPTAETRSPLTPLRVLMCNKPTAKPCDLHGLLIARRVEQALSKERLIKVSLHVAKYSSPNVLDAKGMVRLYQEHDVFVHTGRHHLGTPNPVFEAAACGLHVIATANGCIPELFKTNPNIGAQVKLPMMRRGDQVEDDAEDQVVADEIVRQIREFAFGTRVAGELPRDTMLRAWQWRDLAQEYESVFEHLPARAFIEV
jgi:hypothetical protein